MNHFDTLVEDVDVPLSLPLSREYEPKLWFNGDHFIIHLTKYDFLDIATYSYSDFGRLVKVNRLITGLPLKQTTRLRPGQYKYIQNNHAKIFICYQTTHRPRRPKTITIDSIFLGSQNLTSGTNFNLMYKVSKQHHAPILDFFNSMWRGK